MARSYAIRDVLVQAGVWTPIVCPFHCATVTVENLSAGIAMFVRTDAADSESQKRIPALGELDIRASVATFDKDDVLCWVTLASGSGVAVVEFVR